MNDVKMHASRPQTEYVADVWLSALRPKKADWRRVSSAIGVRLSGHSANILPVFTRDVSRSSKASLHFLTWALTLKVL